jgi:hypothetical protein
VYCVYVQILRGTLTFNPGLGAEIYDHLMVLVLHISAQMFSQLKLMVPSPGIFPDKVCLLAQMPEVPWIFFIYLYFMPEIFNVCAINKGICKMCNCFLYFLLQEEFYKKRVVLSKLLNVGKIPMSDIERYYLELAA